MSTLSVTSKKRSVLWRRVFPFELTVVFVGLVLYAILASINQPASLFVIMIASLTVGNLSKTISLRRVCFISSNALHFIRPWILAALD